MVILLYIAVVIQWLLYTYLPLTALYGILRSILRPDVTDTIRSPFLGLKKVPVKSGFIIMDGADDAVRVCLKRYHSMDQIWYKSTNPTMVRTDRLRTE